MKRRLLLILSVLLPAMLMASPIGKEEAKEKALSFLNGRSSAKARGLNSVKALRLVKTEPCYYVFNIGSRDGFVIVSGDDCAPEILGYADSGEVDPQNMPENMKAWLQGYAEQIEWMKEKGIKAQARSVAKAGVKSAIAPMLSSQWNQSEPYNMYCPKYNFDQDGNVYTKQCVTGCVATAMAQIMYFHQYPNTTSAEIPGYSKNLKVNNTNNTLTTPAVAAGTSIDWSKMKDSYSSSDNSESAQAVARLMQYCGASVNMDYGTKSSFASSSMIGEALQKYFNYDSGIKNPSRSDYTSEEWNDLIYNELVSNRPVLYSGQSSGGGHSFVVDGFEDNYFHINWGWGGDSDSYFLLSVLNPYNNEGVGSSSSKDGYSYGQDAVIGICLPTGLSIEDPIAMTTTSIAVTSDKVLTKTEGNFTVEISIAAYNYTGKTNTFDIAAALIDESGNILSQNTILTNCSLSNGYGFSSLTSTLTFGADLTSGIYRIVAISKLSSETNWNLNHNSNKQHITATISGDNLTLQAPTVALNQQKISVEGTLKAKSTQNVKATFLNGGTDFNNYLYLFANGKLAGGKIFEVAAGGTAEFSIEYVPETAGEYTFKITTDIEGTNSIATINATIAAAEGNAAANLDLSNFNVVSDGSTIYGNTFKVSISAKNNGAEEYKNGFTANLYKVEPGSGGSGYLNQSLNDSQTLTSGETKTISFEFKNLEYDEEYFCYVGYYNGNTFTRAGGYSYNIAHGFVTIDSDGNVTGAAPTASVTVPANAAVVDLRGQETVTTVTSNANPNCIYLLDESADVPSGISANIVKGSTAESITLTDGYDFYTPIDFTANNISYTRTFTTGYTVTDGKSAGWSTICLPFNVETVKTGDKTLEWFTNSTDTKKHFWLAVFTSDDANTVTFDYVQQMLANTPYIIAIPGNQWGDTWKLTGKAITFSGTNANIKANAKATQSGSYLKFSGTTKSQTLTSIYNLNAEGSKFEKGNSTVGAFRAYFSNTSMGSTAASLGIIFGEGTTTGISTIEVQSENADAIYDLRGQKVGSANQLNSLPKGIYIINGKKIIK